MVSSLLVSDSREPFSPPGLEELGGLGMLGDEDGLEGLGMLGDEDGLDGLDGLGMLGDEDGLEGLGMLGGLGVDGVVWGL